MKSVNKKKNFITIVLSLLFILVLMFLCLFLDNQNKRLNGDNARLKENLNETILSLNEVGEEIMGDSTRTFSVRLSQSSIKLAPSESLRLNIVVTASDNNMNPEVLRLKNTSVTSSNGSVATATGNLYNVNITAHNEGNATITVSTDKGTASVNVTVCNREWSDGGYDAIFDSHISRYTADVNFSNYYTKTCSTKNGKVFCPAGQWASRCGYSPKSDGEHCYCDGLPSGAGTTCEYRKDSNANGWKQYDNKYCSTKPEETKCFCNTPTIEEGSLCNANISAPDGIYRYEMPGISKENCKAKEKEKAKGCENNNIKEESSTKKSNVCEGEMEELIVDHTVCGEDDYNNVYYKVTSKTEYKAEFDLNKDGKNVTILDLKSGESITETVKITSKKQIKGVFDSALWLNKYNPLNNEYSRLIRSLGSDKGQAKLENAKRNKDTAESSYNSANSYLNNKSNFEHDETCEKTDENGNEYNDTCTIFDQEAYDKALEKRNYARTIYNNAVTQYNSILDEIRKLKETESQMNELEGIIDFYNATYVNATYIDENEPEVRLSFNYNSDGKSYTSETKFEKNEILSKDGAIDQTSSKAKQLIINFVNARNKTIKTWNIDYNNYDNERVRYFYPPESSIDKKSAETKSIQIPVSGYRRIYTDMKKVDKGVYDISITVDKLGTENKESKIVNDLCKLNVSEEDLTFRVIDISNPFISSSYVPGVNWVGGRYGFNFKGIINSSIWSSGAASAAVLDSSTIQAIQKDNDNNQGVNKYLGTCDMNSSNSVVCRYVG